MRSLRSSWFFLLVILIITVMVLNSFLTGLFQKEKTITNESGGEWLAPDIAAI
jgi:hypothetical protein